MAIDRRDFLHIAAALGLLGFSGGKLQAQKRPDEVGLEDLLEFEPVGKVTLLHICDLHAHLEPLYWREPSTLLSAKNLVGTPGFLCGQAFLKFYGIEPNTLEAYFDTYLNFEELAKKFGKMGGIAHMKTVIDQIRKERGPENVLLLDSGDTWQGTAVALKSRGEAIVDAQNYLGVDVMVGHWEFTYGKERVLELLERLRGDFVSQNIVDDDPFSDTFEETVFPPYTIKEVGGAKIGIIGQSFPFTSTANPKRFTQGWSFGLRLDSLQGYVDQLRKDKGVDCVVVLSHDGFSVDQEVARRVRGIDFILSGHTHDPGPKPITINGTTIIIAGSHGKFIGRLDIDVAKGRVRDFAYKLIPIASNLIPPDKKGLELIERWRAPYRHELERTLGTTKGLLYKRDTFFSTFDRLIGDAIRERMGCEIAFTPGYRWGTTLLPGEGIQMEHIYHMSAITYPEVYTFELKGAQIAQLLEDIADNVFNPNPLYQQGGDMSRLTGVEYAIQINAPTGKRIRQILVDGKPLDPNRSYLVSAWGGNLQRAGKGLREDRIEPVYEVVARYVAQQKRIDIPDRSNVRVLDYECGCPKRGGLC
ncbi:MAG: thiosulfohydrolase SoxB [Nitratiruptor sp.]|nr:thiosulfohydrolase SoxB [Nitratiruptor sp.]NPA83554.1 thiosulfohydrolase SoxB [Campylobacterota bacterium]